MSAKKKVSVPAELKHIEGLVIDGDYLAARRAIEALPADLKDAQVTKDALGKISIERTVLAVSLATICVVLLVLFLTHHFHTH